MEEEEFLKKIETEVLRIKKEKVKKPISDKFLKDLENDEVKKNSGGQSFAISPGMSYSVAKNFGIYANYSFIFNELGGISNDEKYRFSLGVSYAFGSIAQSHAQL